MTRIIHTSAQIDSVETVDSHTVSRFYLNKFANSHKKVWVYKRGLSPTFQSTKSLTTEKRFYEYDFDGDRTDNRFERLFQKLEGRAGKVYSSLVGRMPLKEEERLDWALFVSSLFLRTKKWRKQMIEARLGAFVDDFCSQESIQTMQYDLTLRGQFCQLEQIRKAVRAYAVKVEKQPSYLHLCNLTNSIAKLATILIGKSWQVIQAAPTTQFVSSDAPVSSFRVDNCGAVFGGHGFGKPDVVAVLPISPDKVWLRVRGASNGHSASTSKAPCFSID